MFDPQPDAALDRLWDRNETLADRVEEAIDWIRDGDIRAKRRAFSGGIHFLEVRVADEDWSVLWEEPEAGVAFVRHITPTSSI